jgi:hypothetical protein
VTDDELTREEAVNLVDDLSSQLYRAEDRVAFVREMLASRTEPVAPATVLAWLDHQHCPRVESEQQQIKRLTAERDQYEELLVAGQKATEHWEQAYTREVAAHGRTHADLHALFDRWFLNPRYKVSHRVAYEQIGAELRNLLDQ